MGGGGGGWHLFSYLQDYACEPFKVTVSGMSS